MEGSLKEVPGILNQFKLSTLFRLVLPSWLATFVVYRLIDFQIDIVSLARGAVDWSGVLALLVIFLGSEFLLYICTNQIYQIYEGRTWWPRWLSSDLVAAQQRRVDNLEARLLKSRKAGLPLQTAETWNKLRAYPLDNKGKPTALYPTALGNILAGYEDYPRQRYGMDSVFFWPRLWLTLDKDQKEEIDQQWSTADGLISLSAVAYLGYLVWLAPLAVRGMRALMAKSGNSGAATALEAIDLRLPFASASSSALATIGLLLLGYVTYRFSLPFHRSNGEIFKSIFDLYRERLEPLERLGRGPVDNRPEAENWESVGLYLQYFQTTCRRCGQRFPVVHSTCTSCSYPVNQTFEEPEPRFNRVIEGVRLMLDALPAPSTPAESQPRSPTHKWHFAYDTNMLSQKHLAWQRQAEQAKVKPGRLDDYSLAFDRTGRDGTLEANVVPKKGYTVYGVCYLLPFAEYSALDTLYGAKEGQSDRNFVLVSDFAGQVFEAVIYVASVASVSALPQHELKPSREYLALVVNGAREHDLPDDYIKAIEELGTGTSQLAER